MNPIWKNPVHVKEFRERFRTRKTVCIMASYLFVVGAILLGFIYVSTADTPYTPGDNRGFFISFSALQVALIGFMAPGLAAGTISGERERQTLNILLTTHLSPLSIVISKLISSLAFIAMLVFMSLPLYSFVFLYGGISPDQVFLVFLYYAVNILFFGSMGLLCSTWIKRTGVSTVTAYGFAFFIGVGTALLFAFLMETLRHFHIDPDDIIGMYILYSLNPIFSLFSIFNEGFVYLASLDYAWPSWLIYMICYTVLSIIFIFLSAYLLKPVKRRKR